MGNDRITARFALVVTLAVAGIPRNVVGADAPPAAPVATAVPEEALNDYVIGPGDLLKIEIFELEELSKTVRVTGDGSITYPMLGSVKVEGLAKRALEQKLATLLEEKYVRNPQVTVFVEEMQSGKVSVLGAVTKPGGFGLIGGKTVLEALSQAGGITRDAGTRAFVLRGSSQSPIAIDLRRLMEDGDLSLNLKVEAGDVIYIPKAKMYKVFVYGQVTRPGSFEVDEGDHLTILQAVAMAGGLAKRASAGKTKIVRRGENGRQVTLQIDLDRVLSGKEQDVELTKGDIVVVPQSFF